MPRHRFPPPAALLLALAGTAAVLPAAAGEERVKAVVGEAPPAQVRLRKPGTADEEGRIALARDDRTKPEVLVYWSTRCPVAERYAKTLAAAAEELGSAVDLTLVVTGDDATDEALAETLARQGLGLPVLRDTEGAAAALGVRVTPTALLLDAEGKLRYRGPLDDDRRARGTDARALLVPAVRAVLAGRAVEPAEARPFGSALR